MTRFVLEQSDGGLQLTDQFARRRPLCLDFGDAAFDYRLRNGGGKKEFLARAVGAKPGVTVLDCTAGLGRDAYLLAHLGCTVTMLERSPVLAMLVADALKRASSNPDMKATAARLRLIQTDALSYLGDVSAIPDVITLDPMFPVRKKSASVKGEMQVLQEFIGFDADTDQLVAAALSLGPRRVVIKRPADDVRQYPRKPSHSVKGKSSRFDVFVNPDA